MPLATKNVVAVLLYHSISDNEWGFSTKPKEFEKHIRYLHGNDYRFLNTSDLLDIISGENRSIKKAVLITFDDGYRDLIEHAIPIMDTYKAKGVVFIHTDRSSSQLKNSIPLLDWADIESLPETLEVGNHAYSHPDLKKLSVSDLERETEESTSAIESKVHKKPSAFAYPFGRFTQQTIAILKANGYKLGFTIDRGTVKIGDDPFRVKRFGISRDTSFTEFKARMTSASDWYEKLARVFRNKR